MSATTIRRPLSEATRTKASLYLVEFDDGTVKFGCSDNPQTRLASVATYAKSQFGIAVSKWHVFAGAGAFAGERNECQAARRMEVECLTWFSQIATTRPPSQEFFDGLDFDSAVAHVASVIEQHARRKQAEQATQGA